jgi:hypothetical protein
MPTTTNYGWTTPADTDLVKDGASAIRTLGSSVDTTVKNLNPETTTGAISYRGATANQKVALPIGTAGQVLTVNSGATAPEWTTISAGGMDLLSTTTLSGTTVTVSAISGSYDHLLVTWNGVYHSAGGDPYFRFNSDTGSNYSDWNLATYSTGPSTLPDAHMSNDKLFCMFGGTSSDWDKYNNGNMWIYNYTTTGTVDITIHSSSFNGTDRYSSRLVGRYKNTAAISSITFFQPNGTTSFSGGTLKVWGVR